MHANPRNDHKTIIKKIIYNIPENVAQQIIIWEEEKNAMTSEPAIFFNEFVDEKQYDKYMEVFAANKITILWANKQQSTIIVPNHKKVFALLNNIGV
jgi:hypothetical protein